MSDRYVSVILVSIIGSIVIGLLSIISCCIPISLAILILIGAVTIFLAADDIRDSRGVLIFSAIAGGISGGAGAVISTIGFSLLGYLVVNASPDQYQYPFYVYAGVYGIICLPAMFVAGLILAAIGGYGYYKYVMKK